MNDPKIVPFGKYKGQPIEALAQDKPYLEWLTGQPWFRDKFANLYQTVIVNNFAEASETPEHNALQVLFLEDGFCAAFVDLAKPNWRTDPRRKTAAEAKSRMKTRIEQIGAELYKTDNLIEWETALRQAPDQYTLVTSFDRTFETKGVDVCLCCNIKSNEISCWSSQEYSFAGRRTYYGLDHITEKQEFSIEIKPTIGDDYPAVLRQMRANGSEWLFVATFNASGATREQFVRTFEASGKRVIFRDDVKWPEGRTP